MNKTYPLVGAFIEQENTCTFTVWAPHRNCLTLVLPEKDKKIPLTKIDTLGYWSVMVNDIKPGDCYLYELDEEKSLPDPASCWQPDVHGPSLVIDRSFPWTDDAWNGISLGDMIIYELHVGTFTKQGTFESVIAKLPYLKDLGINAIEIMPVAEFPGSRNWGYDGVYPFAVQDSYGGVTGLKQLVNKAHEYGIAIILDVVYNHFGPEGNYVQEYGPYFTDKYKTGWGKAINFDDAWCDGVRNFYWQNALQWLDEFHIDGLRLDAVHAIWDISAHHFIKELKINVNALEDKTGRKKVLIAEFDLNNPRYLDPLTKGGYALDGQWMDEFHHAVHAVVTGETNGYYEDFGDAEHIAKSIKNSYVYTGQFSSHRKKNFGVAPKDNPYSQFVVFVQNHDQIGNRLLGERLTSQISFEALKLLAATLLLSPHVPMLFMGEEYGEQNPFQYFISHSDVELIELIRKGRKEEFAYFNWVEEIPDPIAEDTFNKCRLSHKYEREGGKLLALYKHLIAFRKERKAMQARERTSVEVFPVYENKVVCFTRKHEDDMLLIILNFDKEDINFSIPLPGAFTKIFDSASNTWGGSGESNFTSAYSQSIFLVGESAIVLEKEK